MIKHIVAISDERYYAEFAQIHQMKAVEDWLVERGINCTTANRTDHLGYSWVPYDESKPVLFMFDTARDAMDFKIRWG